MGGDIVDELLVKEGFSMFLVNIHFKEKVRF